MKNSCLLLLVLSLLILSGCADEDKLIERDFSVKGMTFKMAIPQGGMSSLEIMKLADKAEKSAESRLDLFWGDKSELAKLQEGNGTLNVSPELYSVLEDALYLYQQSDSLWHPLLGSLETAWMDKGKNDRETAVPELLNAIKESHLTLKGSGAIDKGGSARISLRRMAIGYALDGAVLALKIGGAQSGMITVLDLTAVWGRKTKAEEWSFQIFSPSSGDSAYYLFKPPAGVFCIINGTENPAKGAPMLISPETGYPHESTSIVVGWNPSAVMAGGYAEAGMLMGRKEMFSMVRNSPPSDSIGILFLYPDGDQYLLETDLILSETVTFETVEPDEE